MMREENHNLCCFSYEFRQISTLLHLVISSPMAQLVVRVPGRNEVVGAGPCWCIPFSTENIPVLSGRLVFNASLIRKPVSALVDCRIWFVLVNQMNLVLRVDAFRVWFCLALFLSRCFCFFDKAVWSIWNSNIALECHLKHETRFDAFEVEILWSWYLVEYFKLAFPHAFATADRFCEDSVERYMFDLKTFSTVWKGHLTPNGKVEWYLKLMSWEQNPMGFQLQLRFRSFLIIFRSETCFF